MGDLFPEYKDVTVKCARCGERFVSYKHSEAHYEDTSIDVERIGSAGTEHHEINRCYTIYELEDMGWKKVRGSDRWYNPAMTKKAEERAIQQQQSKLEARQWAKANGLPLAKDEYAQEPVLPAITIEEEKFEITW